MSEYGKCLVCGGPVPEGMPHGDYCLARKHKIDSDDWQSLYHELYAKNKQLEARVKELEDRCIKAFMAGQIDCRVDPSYSSAKAWFETEES